LLPPLEHASINTSSIHPNGFMIVNRLASLLAIAALLFSAWLAYYPGIKGGFLFDDYANLPSLGETGRVDNGATFARYITSGTADPLGRPVAMASFLIDARDWPADPEPFKRTNVLLHLVNGFLLYIVLGALGRRSLPLVSISRLRASAWIGAALWTFHPLFVSTTLYIVQREAMLPATFTLTGILAWVKVRQALGSGAIKAATAFAIISLVLCTALAALSKANGILLPILILSIEYTVFSRDLTEASHRARRLHHILLIACWMVAIAIGMALVYVAISSINNGLAHRSWTEQQRLLTEPRILWQYLGQLWMPHPYTAGVFNDAVILSTDIVHPRTTLLAIAALSVVLVGAILCRRRWPFLACAFLFFFSGHLLESTSVPLELYFEHRNYLPAMLLFWPLGLWFVGATQKEGEIRFFPSLSVRYVIAAIVILSLVFMTHANAVIWGDTAHQASLWAALNPASPRAQVIAAQEELQSGAADKAVVRLESMLIQRPTEVQVAFNLVAAHCALGNLSSEHLAAAQRAISTTADPGTLLVNWFDRTIDAVKMGSCHGLDLDDLATLAEAGLGNSRLPAGRRQDIEHVLGAIALSMNQPDSALLHFNRALAYDPREPAALRQAAELGSAGYPARGLSHLKAFDSLPATVLNIGPGMPVIHAWILKQQQYWPRERQRLEVTLRADAAQNR